MYMKNIFRIMLLLTTMLFVSCGGRGRGAAEAGGQDRRGRGADDRDHL